MGFVTGLLALVVVGAATIDSSVGEPDVEFCDVNLHGLNGFSLVVIDPAPTIITFAPVVENGIRHKRIAGIDDVGDIVDRSVGDRNQDGTYPVGEKNPAGFPVRHYIKIIRYLGQIGGLEGILIIHNHVGVIQVGATGRETAPIGAVGKVGEIEIGSVGEISLAVGRKSARCVHGIGCGRHVDDPFDGSGIIVGANRHGYSIVAGGRLACK